MAASGGSLGAALAGKAAAMAPKGKVVKGGGGFPFQRGKAPLAAKAKLGKKGRSSVTNTKGGQY